MSFTITYNILFEVKVLHHFFLNRGNLAFDKMTEEQKANVLLKYDVRNILDISPTADCAKLLDNHKCLFKRTSSGFIVGLRADAVGQQPIKFKPYLSLADDLTFTFLIRLNDPEFMNYTALPLNGNAGRIFVFQNTVSSVPKKFPFISATPPLFNAGSEYMPGDLLSNNLNNPSNLFIAQLKTNKNPAIISDWLSEKKSDKFPFTYANTNDRYPVIRGTLLYMVNKVGVEPAGIVKTASGILVTPEIKLLAGDYRTLQVDMRSFPEGFYTLYAESEDHTYKDVFPFYLMQNREVPFGIMRFTVKSDASLYNMLDAQGSMQSPVYELRFRNRATHWRYIGKKFNESSVTDKPLPLTRFGFIENVKAKDKDGNIVDDLPNPAVTMIKAEALINPAEKKFYSDIHIN